MFPPYYRRAVADAHEIDPQQLRPLRRLRARDRGRDQQEEPIVPSRSLLADMVLGTLWGVVIWLGMLGLLGPLAWIMSGHVGGRLFERLLFAALYAGLPTSLACGPTVRILWERKVTPVRRSKLWRWLAWPFWTLVGLSAFGLGVLAIWAFVVCFGRAGHR